MLAQIGLKSQCKAYSLISRNQWVKLWNFCRSLKTTKCGIVTLLIPEILELFKINKSTLYSWLKQGRETGGFRYYKKISKFEIYIVLGGKKAVCEKLGLTDWGAVVEKPLEEILTKKENQLRQQTTLHHAQWLEMKSAKAAKNAVGKKRFKPYKPKFRSVGKPTPKDPRRATSTATRLNMQPPRRDTRRPNELDRQESTPSPVQLKKTAFSRKHTPTGSSQKTIGEQLGVSERTVRRHLAKTESVQVMYKVTDPKEITQAQAALFYASEEKTKSPYYFIRKGEIYRYGNNLYNLNYSLKSEWVQRIKYKFNLFKKTAKPEIIKNKLSLSVNYSFNDFRELFNKFDLDSLDDQILIVIFQHNLMGSFKEFHDVFKKELKRWKKNKTPLLAGR